MDDTVTRFWNDLVGRDAGLMSFRMILQPLMSTLFAIRDGAHDARDGRPAYFWSLLTNPVGRRTRMGEAWRAIGKIFVFALILDVVYQLTKFHYVYIGEALITAGILAVIPYVLLRGPINRLVRLFHRKAAIL